MYRGGLLEDLSILNLLVIYFLEGFFSGCIELLIKFRGFGGF